MVAALALLALAGREVGPWIPRFTAWVDSLGPLGPLVFILGYAAGCVLLVPGALITLAAGATFGLVRGSIYVFAGASLGATLAFLVSRHLARRLVERHLGADPRLRAIDGAIASQGRRVVLLLRLSPLIPFTLLNYALGLTRVRLVDYVIGCVGMIPATIMYTYSGTLAGEAARLAAGEAPPRGPLEYAFMAAGLAATVVATWLVTRAAKAALREATESAPPAE